jgi:hypothetical protein
VVDLYDRAPEQRLDRDVVGGHRTVPFAETRVTCDA